MEAGDLGGLKKLKIRHDNSGPGANWFLDRVEVEDKMHNRRLVGTEFRGVKPTGTREKLFLGLRLCIYSCAQN